jgi:hypothetical protein
MASQGSCSSDGSSSGQLSVTELHDGTPWLGASVDAVVGTLTVQYAFPGGTKASSINYWVTGPDAGVNILANATVSVGNGTSGTFNIGNIPAGTWALVLTAAPGGGVTCSGTANFSSSGKGTVTVPVNLQCSSSDAGSGWAAIASNPYACGTAGFASAVPSETTVGHSVLLTGSGTAPNPAAITYAWSAPSGSFDTPTAASTHFTCTSAGAVTVTFAVGDGAPADAGTCDPALSTTTAKILCD